jgi:hypothetical protein
VIFLEKWEYKTINIETNKTGEGKSDSNNFNMVINQLGNVGWELVSCFTFNQEQGCTRELIAVLKRKINSGLIDLPDQSSNIEGKAYGHRENGARTHAKAPRSFGTSPKYSEEGHGYKGKSPGYAGKSSGYKGKNSGYTGTDSGHPAKSSWDVKKGTGYKGKSSANARKRFEK